MFCEQGTGWNRQLRTAVSATDQTEVTFCQRRFTCTVARNDTEVRFVRRKSGCGVRQLKPYQFTFSVRELCYLVDQLASSCRLWYTCKRVVELRKRADLLQ